MLVNAAGVAEVVVNAAGVAEVVVHAAAADDEIANGPRVKRRFDAAWQFIVLDRKKGGEDRSAKGMHNGPDWMGNEAERTCRGQPLSLLLCPSVSPSLSPVGLIPLSMQHQTFANTTFRLLVVRSLFNQLDQKEIHILTMTTAALVFVVVVNTAQQTGLH